MPTEEKLPSLDQLQSHIDAVKRETYHPEPTEAHNEVDQKLTPSMRLGIEMVAGAVVGIIIGYLVDEWRGTMPWFTVGFFFAGCLAGFRNLKRLSEPLDKDEDSATTPRA